MPLLKDDYEIPDPKEIVQNAMANTGNLGNAIAARTFDLTIGQWVGSAADVVTALSVPVFMV